MAEHHETMITPPVEELLDRSQSKFFLVTLASRRAREINSYFGQLGEGMGKSVPPQVTSVARKPLSISFEEIAADKIVAVEAPEEPPADEALLDLPEGTADADAEAEPSDDAG